MASHASRGNSSDAVKEGDSDKHLIKPQKRVSKFITPTAQYQYYGYTHRTSAIWMRTGENSNVNNIGNTKCIAK